MPNYGFFTIANRGEQPLLLQDVRLLGSQDFSFSSRFENRIDVGQPNLRLDPDQDGEPGLAPGTTIQVAVEYAPTDLMPDMATILIASNDPDRPELSIELFGQPQGPCLEIEPENLDFGDVVVGTTLRQSVRISACPESTEDIDSIAYARSGVGDFSADLANLDLPAEQVELWIEFEPDAIGESQGAIEVRMTGPENQVHRLSFSGRGVGDGCPVAIARPDLIRALPLDVIELDGSASTDDGPDGQPAEHEWVIIESPDGSTSQPLERFFNNQQPANGGEADDRATPTAQFFVDLAGTYVLELRVRDAQGLSSTDCGTSARLTIIAERPEAIRVELDWDETPGDSMLDLHLLHPNADSWFSSPYDAYSRNPAPDWGQLENPADDPRRDEYATTHTIWLDIPENTDVLGAPYVVGVHAINLDMPTPARVRIYIRDALVWAYAADDESGARLMEAQNHFWDVAAIDWPSGRVVTRDQYSRRRP